MSDVVVDPMALNPAALAVPVRREVVRAVQTRRIGNVPADRGLDILTFFLADVQTGFGPFIAVYLTSSNWSAAQMGLALGVGSIAAMVAQVPAGAAIDALPWKRGAALFALLSVMGSALLLALRPTLGPVIGAEILHGIASCVLVPAVAAISLTRVGRAALAERLGRNARFMAIGNGLGAALMGYAGAHIAASAPFWLTAASTVPAILALLMLPPRHESEQRPPRRPARAAAVEGGRVLTQRAFLAFTGCVLLFQISNTFMLPLAMSAVTREVGGRANLVLAACLMVPQAIVAAFSPLVGRLADRWGRRRVLVYGYAALPIRAVLLALVGHPYLVIAVQALDGVGGAMFGVMQPLVASDLTKGTNRFNLALGVLGLAAGLGGVVSSTAFGWIASHFGNAAAFYGLGAVGSIALAAVWLLMPETADRVHGTSKVEARDTRVRQEPA